MWEHYKLLFDRYVNETNIHVKYLRTQLVFAGPIQYDTGKVHEDGYPIYERYKSLSDRKDEQSGKLVDFQLRITATLESDEEDYYSDLKRYSYSTIQFDHDFDQIVATDLKYAVFSILFVMLYMWFHLGSLFLAVSAMGLIMVSFPVAQFVYRGIFRITMYAQLNKVMVFVIIGIAAANVFVFCDAWR